MTTQQYRATNDNRPPAWWDHPDQEGLWDNDPALVEEEANVQRALGFSNVRIEVRELGDPA